VAYQSAIHICDSRSISIVLAAQRLQAGEDGIYVAGGVESISLVQKDPRDQIIAEDWLQERVPALYWPMLQTAENVAARYGISRDAQDRYGLQSQARAAAARSAGRFNSEIVPISTRMKVVDKATGIET